MRASVLQPRESDTPSKADCFSNYDISTTYEKRANMRGPKFSRLSSKRRVKDKCECARKCNKISKCRGFTYINNTDKCFLKGALREKQFSAGRKSLIFGEKKD